MSTFNVRHTTSQPGLANLAAIGPRLLVQSIRLGSDLLSAAFPVRGSSVGGAGCCEVPETECPPRCVCEIEWRASAGENLKASIRFTNSSKQQTRSFQFSAVPFSGPGNPSTPLTVVPPGATLAPGQSTDISVDFTPTIAFQPGQTYEAEVIIRGAYDQAVCIVFVPESPSHAHCSVEQGDPPVHLHAHQWYDHFQCSEPCYPPRDSKASSLNPQSVPQHDH